MVFPGLGRLRATKENNLFFIPEEDLDIYPAGFGLEPISLKTHQETEKEVSEAVVGLKSILDEAVQAPAPAAPEAQPKPEIKPEVQPEPETDGGSEVEVEPETRTESVNDGGDEVKGEPEDMSVEPLIELVEEPAADLQTKVEKPLWKRLLIAVAIMTAAVILFLVAFVVVARVAPEWMDSILYTPEELEILNRTI